MSDLSYDNVSFPDGAELKVGDWKIFPALNRIARRGKSVSLQNLSMQVLVYLARRPGAVATHDELLDALWPGRIAGQETIHRRIADRDGTCKTMPDLRATSRPSTSVDIASLPMCIDQPTRNIVCPENIVCSAWWANTCSASRCRPCW